MGKIIDALKRGCNERSMRDALTGEAIYLSRIKLREGCQLAIPDECSRNDTKPTNMRWRQTGEPMHL